MQDTLTAENLEDSLTQATYYHETIIPIMEHIRKLASSAKVLIPDEVLPYPTYIKLLFSI